MPYIHAKELKQTKKSKSKLIINVGDSVQWKLHQDGIRTNTHFEEIEKKSSSGLVIPIHGDQPQKMGRNHIGSIDYSHKIRSESTIQGSHVNEQSHSQMKK